MDGPGRVEDQTERMNSSREQPPAPAFPGGSPIALLLHVENLFEAAMDQALAIERHGIVGHLGIGHHALHAGIACRLRAPGYQGKDHGFVRPALYGFGQACDVPFGANYRSSGGKGTSTVSRISPSSRLPAKIA